MVPQENGSGGRDRQGGYPSERSSSRGRGGSSSGHAAYNSRGAANHWRSSDAAEVDATMASVTIPEEATFLFVRFLAP